MTLTRDPIPSPNCSSRGGAVPRLLVVHTTQGASSYASLGSFFANPGAGVSSHAGIDDTPGRIGVFVRREHKAWTQANMNPVCVSAELCAWSEWDAAEWNRHPVMLSNTAAWLAEESVAFGIPLVELTDHEAQSGAAGVCDHNALGAAGGNHWDCGNSFPLSAVLEEARGGTITTGGAMAICSTPSGHGYWVCGSDGGVFTYGDAEFHGSLGDVALDAPITSMAATPTGHGYWLLGEDGGVFTFGDAVFYGAPTGLVR